MMAEDYYEYEEDDDEPEPALIEAEFHGIEEVRALLAAGYTIPEIANLCRISYYTAQKLIQAQRDSLKHLYGRQKRGRDGKVYPRRHRPADRTPVSLNPVLANAIAQARSDPKRRATLAAAFRAQRFSLREIACILCVSHEQVRRDLKASKEES